MRNKTLEMQFKRLATEKMKRDLRADYLQPEDIWLHMTFVSFTRKLLDSTYGLWKWGKWEERECNWTKEEKED